LHPRTAVRLGLLGLGRLLRRRRRRPARGVVVVLLLAAVVELDPGTSERLADHVYLAADRLNVGLIIGVLQRFDELGHAALFPFQDLVYLFRIELGGHLVEGYLRRDLTAGRVVVALVELGPERRAGPVVARAGPTKRRVQGGRPCVLRGVVGRHVRW